MPLLKLRMPWLKLGAVMVTIFVIAAPALADPEPDSTIPAQKQAAPPPPPEGPAPAPAPGEFKVDKDAAERALERTLVVQGALLLPFGQVELQPSFIYTRSKTDNVNQFIQGGTPFLVKQDIRTNAFTSDLSVRFGLPFDSQLEFGIPYRIINNEQVTSISGIGSNQVSGNNSGFGDFRLGLAKGLLREGLWWPNLIGRVTWDSDFGRATPRGSDLNTPLGSGFNELTGSLTATKRQDPLVFLGSVSYTTSFEENHVEPGDQFGFSVGALLAASPETSLRIIIDQTFANDFRINGKTIKGTDRAIANLSFGASSIVGHGKFIDLTATAGLTDAAPDYSVGVTFVVRFDIPNLSI